MRRKFETPRMQRVRIRVKFPLESTRITISLNDSTYRLLQRNQVKELCHLSESQQTSGSTQHGWEKAPYDICVPFLTPGKSDDSLQGQENFSTLKIISCRCESAILSGQRRWKPEVLHYSLEIKESCEESGQTPKIIVRASIFVDLG